MSASEVTRAGRGSPTSVPAIVVLVLLVGVLGLAAGCTGDSGGSSEPGSNGSASGGRAVGQARTTVGLVRGRLPAKARERLSVQISKVVDGWVDAAYGGQYPREDFRGSYPGFTGGAQRQARQDAALMSNAVIGDRIDAVSFSRRRVRLDVLAVKRRAVAVTARFVLVMDVSGDPDRSERIVGNLYLTRQGGGWKVFGYDAKRGTR